MRAWVFDKPFADIRLTVGKDRAIKHLVVGFTTGFPIGFHDFGNNRPNFTAVDVDFMGVVGLRL
jgi:hypothetical protein